MSNTISMNKPIIIIGAGGQGRIILDICNASGLSVSGFLDNNIPKDQMINKFPIIGNDELLEDTSFIENYQFIVAIGNNLRRLELTSALKHFGAIISTAIHPKAIISEHSSVSSGSVIVQGSIINCNTKIGSACIINTGCTIDHDCVIGDGSHIGPGANLAGGVKCGLKVLIGTGASIAPRVTIGNNSVIGVGTSITRDVPQNTMVTAINPVSKAKKMVVL